MLLQALSLSFLLQLSTATTYCPEQVPACPSDQLYHRRVNETIHHVLTDINRIQVVKHQFVEKFERDMHAFILDLRVALLTDQRLLERLLHLQKMHGPNFTGHPDFDKECDQYNIKKPQMPSATTEEPCDDNVTASDGSKLTTVDPNGIVVVPLQPPPTNGVFCPDAVPECPSDIHFHRRVNETIQAVMSDINRLSTVTHQFIEKYEKEMHEFILDLRVALLTDKKLLERLLLLQKKHGHNFTGHPDFEEECDNIGITKPTTAEESCEEGSLNATTTNFNTSTTSAQQMELLCLELLREPCADCELPEYIAADHKFVCPYGTSFIKDKVKMYSGRFEYKQAVECKPYGNPPVTAEEVEKCNADCDKTASCRLFQNETICTCKPGDVDRSAEQNRTTGSVCQELNGSTPSPTRIEMGCRELIKEPCADCVIPEYIATSQTFVCPNGTSFDKHMHSHFFPLTIQCRVDVFTAKAYAGRYAYWRPLECKAYDNTTVTDEKNSGGDGSNSTQPSTTIDNTPGNNSSTPSPVQIATSCKDLIREPCMGSCVMPEYNATTQQFVCPHTTSFIDNKRTLNCRMDGFSAKAYTGRFEYNYPLQCTKYGRSPMEDEDFVTCGKSHCDQSASCQLYKEEEVYCECLHGYIDLSADTNLLPGSVCQKCKNMENVDFVILYDNSGSMRRHDRLMLNSFMKLLSEWTVSKERNQRYNNRIAIINFADKAKVSVPLTNDIEQIPQFLEDVMKNPDIVGVNTNTAKAMYVANKEIYSTLSFDSNRRRVTILLTDGAPSICNAYRNRSATDFVTIVEGLNEDSKLSDCFEAELSATRKELTEKHKAEVFVVQIGARSEEDKKWMKVIHKDDQHLIHNEGYEDLQSSVLGKLQKKICG